METTSKRYFHFRQLSSMKAVAAFDRTGEFSLFANQLQRIHVEPGFPLAGPTFAAQLDVVDPLRTVKVESYLRPLRVTQGLLGWSLPGENAKSGAGSVVKRVGADLFGVHSTLK